MYNFTCATEPPADEIQSLLPWGLAIVGVVAARPNTAALARTILATAQPCFAIVQPQDGGLSCTVVRRGSNDVSGAVEASAPPAVTLLRCTTELTVQLSAPAGAGRPPAEAVARAFADAEAQLSQQGMAFLAAPAGTAVEGSAGRVLLTSAAAALPPLPGSASALGDASQAAPAAFWDCVPLLCTTVPDTAGSASASGSGNRSGVSGADSCQPVATLSYVPEAPASSGKGGIGANGATLTTPVTLQLDALCYRVPGASQPTSAVDCLTAALRQQLRSMRAAVSSAPTPPPTAASPATGAAVAAAAQQQATSFAAHHFRPAGCGHFVTLCYPTPSPRDPDACEALLQPRRLALHRLLGLPEDRPALRLANAVPFAAFSALASANGSGNSASGVGSAFGTPGGAAAGAGARATPDSGAAAGFAGGRGTPGAASFSGTPGMGGATPGAQGRLWDVHATLAPQPLADCITVTVEGSYEYYHYLQASSLQLVVRSPTRAMP